MYNCAFPNCKEYYTEPSKFFEILLRIWSSRLSQLKMPKIRLRKFYFVLKKKIDYFPRSLVQLSNNPPIKLTTFLY